VRAPEDPFEAQGNRDALVELSGALKVIAVSLTKIANDLALMGSARAPASASCSCPSCRRARRSCRARSTR
jgi:fumarate hydratase class II